MQPKKSTHTQRNERETYTHTQNYYEYNKRSRYIYEPMNR